MMQFLKTRLNIIFIVLLLVSNIAPGRIQAATVSLLPTNPVLFPSANTIAAPGNTKVAVTYSEDILASSVSYQTFPVWGSQTGRISGTYQVVGGEIGFAPGLPFHPGELVAAAATTGILGAVSEQGSDQPTVWQFRIGVNPSGGFFATTGQSLSIPITWDISFGDSDADGDLDALLATEQGARLWLNDGTGHFSDSQMVFGSFYSAAAKFGDLDGDGDLDAIVLQQSNGINHPADVWINQGGNGFTLKGTLASSSLARSLALGDLNGDGTLDAFIGTDTGSLAFINDGSGVFTSGPLLASGAVYGAALGDLDGDGDLDAFAATANGQSDRIWLNDGSATFSSSGQSIGADSGYDVALGDLDSDGDLDAMVANRFNTSVDQIWLNNGSGVLNLSTHTLTSSSSTITLGDIDGDGDLDGLAGKQVWLNDGAADFTAGQTLGGVTTDALELGDLNGDGGLDLLFEDPLGKVWLNTQVSSPPPQDTRDPAVYFEVGGVLPGPVAPHSAIALGDLDNDGDLDTFIGETGYISDQTLHYSPDEVMLNQGNGLFTSTGQHLGDNSERTVWTFGVALGDLNGDQLLDAVTVGMDNLAVWFNTGAGQFTQTQYIDSGVKGFQEPWILYYAFHSNLDVALADVDGDGDLDAVIANGYLYPYEAFYPGPNTILINDGTGHFTPSSQLFGEDAYSQAVAVGDLDGDGDPDIYMGNRGFDQVFINMGGIQGGTKGQFVNSGQQIPHAFTNDVALADLDGDGDLDAFATGGASGGAVLLNDGTGFFNLYQSVDDPLAYAVALEDLDGDGDPDAFLSTQSHGLGAPDHVWLNGEYGLPQGEFISNRQQLGNGAGTGVALGDLNGDGWVDAFVTNMDAMNQVWINQGLFCCILTDINHQCSQPAITLAATGGALQSQVDLGLFSRIRDQLLVETGNGQHYVGLYYTYIPELARVLLADGALRQEGIDTLQMWQPNLQALVDGQGAGAIINQAQVNSVMSFLDHLSAAASPGLQQVIAEERLRLPPNLVGMNMKRAQQILVDDHVWLPVIGK